MKRPSQVPPWQQGRGAPNRPTQKVEEIRLAKEKADADKRRLLDRLRTQKQVEANAREARAAALHAKRDRLKCYDVDAALAAARRFQFFDLEAVQPDQSHTLNRPTLALLEYYLRVLQGRASVSVLQWPHDTSDVSNLHALAMLAVLCASPTQSTGPLHWCRAVPDFRTLYFPWRGSGTGLSQRRILLERTELMKRNGLHLTRTRCGEPESSAELAKLHLTVGHLTNLKTRDTSKPHLAHPTLSELYPTFGALGGDNAPALFGAPVYELFGRVAYGAALTRLHDDRSAISQPSTAPFALFGICPRSAIRAAMTHPAMLRGREPDACILDLNSPGISRLGPAWDRELESFLALFAKTYPETPVLSVTQDTFVHRKVSNLLREFGLSDASSRASRVLLRSSDDLFTADPEIGEVSPVKFQFHSTAGNGAAALRALSDAARGATDPAIAGALRNVMGAVRRTMSLPCGLRKASDTLTDTEGQEVAEAFLERRSAGTVLSVIQRHIELSTDAAERARLQEAGRAVDKAFEEFEDDTPIGSLLAGLAGPLARKSSQSVIAFAREEDRILGESRICDDSDEGVLIRKRIESGYMRLATLQDLDSELADIEQGRSRNMWKRLVVVAPPRDQFAVMLGRRWLPEEIIVLSDREFVEKLAGTYHALSTHPDLTGESRLGGRLAAAAAAARAEAKARDVAPVALELDAQAPVVIDERVIDLTSGDEDDDHAVIEIGLESGRLMRVRPRGLVIRYDGHADVNPFERTTGHDVAKGDTIVVPNQIFVQEARAVLSVRVLAQARVSIYHAAVESAVPALPGASRSAKARHVIQRMQAMGARAVVEATVLDWLNAAQHRQAAAERLRPHAPQHWREFRAFMEVVGIPADLADKIWREGIEPLRIDRRRAGARVAQAFVSVLVDPHGGGGLFTAEVKEQIDRLRRQALDHLDGVLSVEPRNGTEERAS